jgi:type IV pilus assembly protein PilB
VSSPPDAPLRHPDARTGERPWGVSTSRRFLGALLREEGVLSAPDLERALRVRERTGERLGEVVTRLELAPEEAVARALARQLGLPFVPPPLEPDPEALRLVPRSTARRRRILPLALSPRGLRIAMGDPLDVGAVDELQFRTGRRVEAVVTTASGLRSALRAAYAGEVTEVIRSLPSGDPRNPVRRLRPGRYEGAAHPRSADEAPVSRLVDALVQRAAEGGASDLHVEQAHDEVVVRERVDGLLRRVTGVPAGARGSLLSRIKLLAGMDISVKRRPQDGGFTVGFGRRTLAVRVSTLPVEGGEKAVLRLLDPAAAPSNLEELGFSPANLDRLRELLRAGRGVILAAGPTGSGKSSTLFGALGELDREVLNIVTLEDPIEYRVEGVNQVQVNPRAGLTFPSSLRAVLRQDPDVVMVGEIRDRETAEIAMAAAMTGHLVLSSVHTTTRPGRSLACSTWASPPTWWPEGSPGWWPRGWCGALRQLRGPRGLCEACHGGYRGASGSSRSSWSQSLREDVLDGASTSANCEGGPNRMPEWGPWRDDARRKVAEGVTTPT